MGLRYDTDERTGQNLKKLGHGDADIGRHKYACTYACDTYIICIKSHNY